MAPMVNNRRKPRRFRVYIETPSGRCTRGRYYNKPRSAWNRRRDLLSMLTERHRVIIFNQQMRVKVSDCHGWGKVMGMCIFARASHRAKA